MYYNIDNVDIKNIFETEYFKDLRVGCLSLTCKQPPTKHQKHPSIRILHLYQSNKCPSLLIIYSSITEGHWHMSFTSLTALCLLKHADFWLRHQGCYGNAGIPVPEFCRAGFCFTAVAITTAEISVRIPQCSGPFCWASLQEGWLNILMGSRKIQQSHIWSCTKYGKVWVIL